MSNYTKTTNFASKDNLSPGNPLKIVKGTEIDTEFNNIQTAVGTKTDNASAAITGGTITGITDLAVADGGTGASTAAGALNNLLPSQTSAANKYLQSDGTNASWDAVSLSTADITGTLAVANGGTGVTSSTGTGNVVLSNSPTLVTPDLGTPASGTATNLTGLPISTGVSGLGTGVATFLGTPSSANLASAVTDETGSGALVFANSPTLITPALGTPSALVGTNITGTASGLTAGNVTTNANLTGAVTSVGNATSLGSFSSANLLGALTDETGTGSAVFATSPTLVTPILGTPTSATLTNATGLPLTTGVTGQLPVANGGTGTATPSIVAGTNVTVTGTWPNQTIAASGGGGGTPGGSTTQVQYNNAGAFGGITGATSNGTALTLVAPVLGTPASATLTNATGLPLSTGVTGTLPVANGGTGQTSYTDGQLLIGNSTGNTLTKATLTAGTNVTITNAAGAITIAASGGGSSQWTTSGSDIYFNGNAALRGAVTTPSIGKIFEVGFAGQGISSTSGVDLSLSNNAYYNAAWKYGQNGLSSKINLSDDQILFSSAATGTAGNSISYTDTLAVQLGKTLALQGATVKTGTGITFPATQSASTDANTLDDYEEGTWTPTYTGSTGSIGSTAYAGSGQNGSYTKIGNCVTVWCRLILTSKGSWTGEVRIAGLPFTVGATPSGGCQGALESRTINFTNYATVRGAGGDTYLEIVDSKDNTGSAIITTAEISDNSGFLFTLTYFI